MKEKILNNLTLKLLALILSIVIWILIVNAYDPYMSMTFSGITVQLENEETLTDKGYTYTVLDGSRISVTVSGPSSKLSSLSSSNIIATADLSTLSDTSDYVDITVRVEKNGRAVEDVTATPSQTSVRLSIENRSSKTLDIQLTTVGSLEDNYALLNSSISPETVTITGASSDVDEVAYASAIYDLTGISEDIDDTASIVLYDSSGNTIDSDSLTLSTREVHYTADVELSKEVSLVLTTSGKPAAGYKVSSITPESDTIVITGDSSVINSISEVAIPSDALNVEGLSDSTTFRLWIEDYLPSDVSLASESMITVRVEIEPEAAGTITLPASEISVTGVEDGLTGTVSTENLTIQVEGSQSAIDSLTAESLQASVSAEGLSEGSHTVDISFSPPSGVYVTGEYEATLTLSEKSSQTSTQSTSSTQTSVTRTSSAQTTAEQESDSGTEE